MSKILDSRASSSSIHIQTEKSSQEDGYSCKRKADLKQLEGRLKVLEEEIENLKIALMESVEGRTKLMSEIYEHFETLQHFLLEKKHTHCISLVQNRKAGLLQVLWQEPNPSLVNRGLRADALGYDVHEFSS